MLALLHVMQNNNYYLNPRKMKKKKKTIEDNMYKDTKYSVI